MYKDPNYKQNWAARNPERHAENEQRKEERKRESSAKGDQKRRAELTPEKKKERQLQSRECTARWRKENPDKAKELDRAHRLKRKLVKHGVTHEQFAKLLQLQNGVCAICGLNEEGRRLSVDHDHTTEKVRGLICSPCNFMLGSARDKPATLRAAALYLESPPFDRIEVA